MKKFQQTGSDNDKFSGRQSVSGESIASTEQSSVESPRNQGIFRAGASKTSLAQNSTKTTSHESVHNSNAWHVVRKHLSCMTDFLPAKEQKTVNKHFILVVRWSSCHIWGTKKPQESLVCIRKKWNDMAIFLWWTSC